MNTTPSPVARSPMRGWRFPLVVSLSVGTGLSVAETVEHALLDSAGRWPAVGFGLVTAAAMSALAALTINLLLVSWNALGKTLRRNRKLSA